MSEETKKESAAKLKAWADHDKAKAEREMAFNDLESACTDMEGEQSKLNLILSTEHIS